MDSGCLYWSTMLTLLLNHAHLLIKQILIFDVQATAELVISPAISNTFNFELVFISKF